MPPPARPDGNCSLRSGPSGCSSCGGGDGGGFPTPGLDSPLIQVGLPPGLCGPGASYANSPLTPSCGSDSLQVYDTCEGTYLMIKNKCGCCGRPSLDTSTAGQNKTISALSIGTATAARHLQRQLGRQLYRLGHAHVPGRQHNHDGLWWSELSDRLYLPAYQPSGERPSGNKTTFTRVSDTLRLSRHAHRPAVDLQPRVGQPVVHRHPRA